MHKELLVPLIPVCSGSFLGSLRHGVQSINVIFVMLQSCVVIAIMCCLQVGEYGEIYFEKSRIIFILYSSGGHYSGQGHNSSQGYKKSIRY
jgi:hypothetical protein